MNIKKLSLDKIFIATMRYVAEIDAQKVDQTLEELIYENQTFNERTVRTFTKFASEYYTKDEITKWIQETLLDIKELPKLE